MGLGVAARTELRRRYQALSKAAGVTGVIVPGRRAFSCLLFDVSLWVRIRVWVVDPEPLPLVMPVLPLHALTTR